MLDLLCLLFDFGLVVLIWMVQLIVYPSFLYYTSKNLLLWHQKYTQRLALIVIPLMLGQLILSAFQVYQNLTSYSLSTFLIVLFLWGITLLKFAPMHGEISQGNTSKEFLTNLVRWNWIRTVLWSLLFVIHLFVWLQQ